MGLLASSLLTVLTGAQASGLGARMEQAMAAPSPAKTSKTRRLSSHDVTASLKNMLADGASLAVLELGARGGFNTRSGHRIATLNEVSGYDAEEERLARAAESTASQAGPILREAINALHIPDPRALFETAGSPATAFFHSHSAEHLRLTLAPVAARAYAAAAESNITGRQRLPVANSHAPSPRLADHIAHGTVEALLDVIGQQERSMRCYSGAPDLQQLVRHSPTAVT